MLGAVGTSGLLPFWPAAPVLTSTRTMVFRDEWAPSDDEAEEAAMDALLPSLLSAEALLGRDDEPLQAAAAAATPIASPSTPRYSEVQPNRKCAPAAACAAGKRKRKAESADDEAPSPASRDTASEDARRMASIGLTPWAPPEAIQAQRLLCVVGGCMKSPVVLRPHVDGQGKDWILINEHLPWLRRALGASGSTHWSAALQSAVTALRGELRTKLHAARQATTAQGQQLQLREQLALDDAGKPKAKSLRRSKGDSPRNALKVTFMGVDIEMLNSARPVALSATPECVLALVQFCRDHIGKGPLELKRNRREKPVGEEGGAPAHPPAEAAPTAAVETFHMPAAPCPGHLGKITWHPSATAWAAHWKDASGRSVVTRFGVKVEANSVEGLLRRASGQGEVQDTFAARRRRRYEEAIVFWNEHDKSKRERIAMPDTASAQQAGSQE